MDIKEQRDKLLNVAKEAIKYANAYRASEHASLVGTQRVSSFIRLTESLIARIEAEIAGEDKPWVCNQCGEHFPVNAHETGEVTPYAGAHCHTVACGDSDSDPEPCPCGPVVRDHSYVSPRVQIIRRAKRLIEALNLLEGSKLSFDGENWNYHDGSSWWPLHPNVLPDWPNGPTEITRDTPETEEV